MTQPTKRPFDWSIVWVAIVVVFLFWPWAVGIVDMISVMLTGNVYTSVPWTADRKVVFVFWPLFWGFVMVIFAALLGG